MAPPRFERLGLRSRITFFFAFGGLLLSVTIALATLALTRENLLAQREDLSFEVASSNGLRVRNTLTPDTTTEGLLETLGSLSTTDGTFPLVWWNDTWTAAQPLVFNGDNVPEALVEVVSDDQAGRIRATIDGRPYVVTGFPLADRDGDPGYYEALELTDVEDTLESLALIVFGVGAATTLTAAMIGAWASRRTLTPLVQVRTAAEALAAGELDTRLERPADADLASLAGSFNEMAGALEDRIERDARFASEVSHELRSPLMTLAASAEVLNNMRDQLSERGRTALDLLTDDIARFTSLVEDLLEISRFDVGTASLHAEAVHFTEFVRQAVAHSGYDNVEVQATESAEKSMIVADKRRIGQVIANLLGNADRYGDGMTTVFLDRTGALATLIVEDEGVGVAPDERHVIFDRFSRGTAGGQRGQDLGSGLGLPLVAEHIGLHGGRVWVEDRPDGRSGARFVAIWPVGELAADPDDDLDAPDQPSPEREPVPAPGTIPGLDGDDLA